MPDRRSGPLAIALVTPWSRTLGLRAPVLNAPMGGVAGGRLAAAVSSAGGLGMIGVGSAGSATVLEEEVAVPRATGAKFGIGLLDWAIAEHPELLDVALEAAPVLLAVSFGEDWTWVERVRDAGIVTVTQVATVEEAERAAGAGIDVLVARGAEGGGHGTPAVGTLPLLDGVLDAVSVPVLAAGGISTARGLAAVLAAGAAGAWIGTAFAACTESLASADARRALIAASGADTVTTSVFDIALGHPWPGRFPERVLRSEFWERWDGREGALHEEVRRLSGSLGSGGSLLADAEVVDAGQGVGAVVASTSAAEVVEELRTGAIELLRASAPQHESDAE